MISGGFSMFRKILMDLKSTRVFRAHGGIEYASMSGDTKRRNHPPLRLSIKAYSEIRRKEVISARFPITKSELPRCCARDKGPI